MKLKHIIQFLLLFVLFLVGYGLYGQSIPATTPTDGKQLFFFVAVIIATALGRNVDKVIDKLISLIPSNPKSNVQRKSEK